MYRAARLRHECAKPSPTPKRKSAPCGRKFMRTRDAILPDAEKIHELISSYSGDGTLLPRNFAEICENVRDFVVLEHRGKIVGCGALHLYGQHLAEIRSITVDPKFQRQGGGKRLMQALMEEAEKHQVGCICLFTRKPA